MLIDEYLKTEKKLSETIKKLENDNKEIKDMIEQSEEDFSPIFEIFFKITKKLHSRRKILDFRPSDKNNCQDDRIVLHQFGFHVLDNGRQRSRPMSMEDLLDFLKDVPEDVIDKIADEIPYKHSRMAFREYCKMVKRFIMEHNITDIKMTREKNDLKMSCKKKIRDKEGKMCAIDSLEIGRAYVGGNFIILVMKKKDTIHEFNLNDIDNNINDLIIFEQLETEILEIVKKFKQKIKKNTIKIGEQFFKELNEKFSPFIVAEQL